MKNTNPKNTKIRCSVLIILWLVGTIYSGASLPNIVILISDDLGRLDTSVYGSRDVRTPTLDALAARGMVFENAYVSSPSCRPSRASLLTGLMPARHGAQPNHSQMKSNTKQLTPILKELGYRIASFGKIEHMSREFDGCDFIYKDTENMSSDLQKFFDSGQAGEGPLCLLVGDRRPHVKWTKEPIYEPDRLSLPPTFIDSKETREHWARYLTDISHMDSEMARALQVIEQQIGGDYICLFTSDHGGQWPLGKWNLYDSGTRVPLIVSWPGRIEPGSRTQAMVSWVDLIPTLIDLAGGSVPWDIDGISFSEVLMNKSNAHRTKIFTTHTGDAFYNVYPMRSVRVVNFKLIHNLLPDALHTNHSDILRNDGRAGYWDSWDASAVIDPRSATIVKNYYIRPEFELFNLNEDPDERHNLAYDRKYKTKMAELRSELLTWTTAQGDDLKPHLIPYLKQDSWPEIRAKIAANKKR